MCPVRGGGGDGPAVPTKGGKGGKEAKTEAKFETLVQDYKAKLFGGNTKTATKRWFD